MNHTKALTAATRAYHEGHRTHKEAMHYAICAFLDNLEVSPEMVNAGYVKITTRIDMDGCDMVPAWHAMSAQLRKEIG